MPYMPPIFPVIRITFTKCLPSKHGRTYIESSIIKIILPRHTTIAITIIIIIFCSHSSLSLVLWAGFLRGNHVRCVLLIIWMDECTLSLWDWIHKGRPTLWMSCVYVQLVILFHLDGYDDYDIGRHTEEKNTRFPSWKYDGVWSPVVLAHCLC